MSVHCLDIAASMKFRTPSVKLAMLCFADSADKETRVAFPGFDNVMTWVGLGRSQTFEIIAELKEQGLIRQLTEAHRGHRAEFLVFPDGCCPLHKPIPKESGPPDPPQSGPPDPLPEKGSDDQGERVRNGSDAAPDPSEPPDNSATTPVVDQRAGSARAREEEPEKSAKPARPSAGGPGPEWERIRGELADRSAARRAEEEARRQRGDEAWERAIRGPQTAAADSSAPDTPDGPETQGSGDGGPSDGTLLGRDSPGGPSDGVAAPPADSGHPSDRPVEVG